MHKYYLEIKNRFILLLLTWFFSLLILYTYKEIILFLSIKPSLLCNNNIFYFIFTDIKEIFYIYLKLVFVISNQIIFIFFILQLLIFLSLGLYKFEYNYIKIKLKISFIFLISSFFIFNNILLPISFNFFLKFKNFVSFTTLKLHFEAKLIEYLNFYLLFYYICIFYCQFFMFLIFFFDYIKFNLKLIKKYRKIFYYSFVFFATLITPPDVISQILMSFILIFIYESLIFINLLKLSITKIN